MAVTFPNSPTLGQEYTAENGLIYIWDGEKWKTQGSYAGDAGLYIQKDGSNTAIYADETNVGIGTTTPTHKLTVDGTVLTQTIPYGSSNDAAYLIAGSASYDGTTTNWGTHGFQHRIKSNAGGAARITVDSHQGELLCVHSSGRVGLGTDNPDELLDIRAQDAVIRITDTDTDAYHRFNANSSGGNLGIEVDEGSQFTDANASSLIISARNRELARFAGGSGHLRLSTDSAGIQFKGNTGVDDSLDDYEEGTWIPTYIGSTTNPNCTYDVQGGRYVKIGRVVHCEGRIRTDAVSGGSGNLLIAGLPFLSAPESTVRAGIDIGVGSAFLSGGYRPTEGLVVNNNTTISLFRATQFSYANITVADGLGTGTNKNSFQFSVTYLAAST